MTKGPGGRPTKYSIKLVTAICDRLSHGETLIKICEGEEFPHYATVLDWLNHKDKREFYDMYTEARRKQALYWADQIIGIANDSESDHYVDEAGKPCWNYEHIHRARLRVDTLKWVVSKMLPKVFGDKVIQEISGPDGGAIQLQAVDRPPAVDRQTWLENAKREIKVIGGGKK